MMAFVVNPIDESTATAPLPPLVRRTIIVYVVDPARLVIPKLCCVFGRNPDRSTSDPDPIFVNT